MHVKRHNPKTIARPQGGYSHGIEVAPHARWLFISGTVPERPDGTVPETFTDQCHVIWDNLEAILAGAGMTVNHVIKVTTFLTDRSQIEQNRDVLTQRLKGAQPALTVVVAQTLDPAWLLEIEAVAAAETESSR